MLVIGELLHLVVGVDVLLLEVRITFLFLVLATENFLNLDLGMMVDLRLIQRTVVVIVPS